METKPLQRTVPWLFLGKCTYILYASDAITFRLREIVRNSGKLSRLFVTIVILMYIISPVN